MIAKKIGIVVCAALAGFFMGSYFYGGMDWVTGLFKNNAPNIANSDRMLSENPKSPEVEKAEPPAKPPVLEETIKMIPVEKTATAETAPEIPAEPVPEEVDVAESTPEPEEKSVSGQQLAYVGQNQPASQPDLLSEHDTDFRGVSQRLQAQIPDDDSNGGGSTDPVDPVDPVDPPEPRGEVTTLADAAVSISTEAAEVDAGANIQTTEETAEVDVKMEVAAAAVETQVTPPAATSSQQNWYSNGIAGSVSGLIGGVSPSSTSTTRVTTGQNRGRVVIRGGSSGFLQTQVGISDSTTFTNSTTGAITTTVAPGLPGVTTAPVVSGGGSTLPVSIPSTTSPVINRTTGLIPDLTGGLSLP